MECGGLCQIEGVCQYVAMRIYRKTGGFYLGSLRLDFTGTRERAVDFTHDCGSSSLVEGSFSLASYKWRVS